MIGKFPIHLCMQMPYATVRCDYSHRCHNCEVADRIRKNRLDGAVTHEMFGYYDVKKRTPKGGGLEWVNKALVLKPEAMERAGIKVDLYHQIFISTGGSGMLSINPVGMVDGYTLADRKTYTFIRSDFFGIPTEAAAEKFDKLFITNIKKMI